MAMRRVLITGTAGFIGFHLARRLLADDDIVIGIDGMTPYYDVALKARRHANLAQSNRFTAHEMMLEDEAKLRAVIEEAAPDLVIHLAAQAGVRYSLENPRSYIDSNLVGTFNLLEAMRRQKPAHFLMASTSSVYGANADLPFGENDRTDHPTTLYAATKKATEDMAHAYAHLFAIPTTAFRFFTVYGPWGRPDMALFRFVAAILEGRSIDVYGHGAMSRDFTYIDDLVEAVVRLAPLAPAMGQRAAAGPDSLSPAAPYRVVNIGGGEPVPLLTFIETIERVLGRRAVHNMMPIQPGEVPATYARADLLRSLTGFRPATPIETGVRAFVDWYLAYQRDNIAAVTGN